MPEITGERGGGQGGPVAAAGVDDEVDPHDIIPLHLVRSQRIPPAPNRRQSAIDWLPDFAGFSWIAYGASSLAVIAHCASPQFPEETKVGSFFQQVIEPPTGDPGGWSSEVNAVAWCPLRPSDGYIAIARGDRVDIYSPDMGVAGSLRWQHAVHLSHSSTVEAVCWTMSGDGLISVGTEITFWKRNVDLWEVTIKLRTEVPQTLVATTWSLNGPVASAAGVAHSPLALSMREIEDTSPSFEASRHVLVCQNNGKSGHTETKLSHTQPVFFIQWRPLNMGQAKRHPNYLQRDVLLTSCFDGVVRLWCKIDGGKSRKVFKDIENGKSKAYHVIAAIEIDQCLKAALGTDVFVSWGTETYGAISIDGAEQRLPAGNSDCGQTGICEWLIGVGPSLSLTFWALHCLDDTAPLRFPRVTLWKKHDKILHGKSTNVISQSILIKTVMSRKELYSPPKLCCLLQLLPNNSISWLQLSDARPDAEDIAQFCLKDSLSSFIISDQSLDGHEGAILHVAVHPCSEVDIIVSMDANGILLFWSISSISTFPLGVEPLQNAAWKLLGRVALRELSCDIVEYSSLAWVPSVFGEDRFLLLGHAKGIGCYLVKFSDMENGEMICNRMFTVSFAAATSSCDGPYKIFAFLLPSNCRQPLVFNHFIIFAVWEREFQVLSWDITMHAEYVSESTCCSNPDCAQVNASSTFRCMSSCADWLFHVKVKPCSRFPVSQNYGQVTSYNVVSSDFLIPSVKLRSSSEEPCSLPYFYHIVTGHSDGSLRFWRINYETLNGKDSDISCLPWELVGLLTSHQDPVHLIAWSNCGSKLATVCLRMTGSSSMLHIWGSMSLVRGGCFFLEDKILLRGAPVALSWLQLGNGLLLLGVCMHNELQMYTQLRVDKTVSSKFGRSVNPSGWSCIAVCQSNASIVDFIWGPKATPVLIHEKYFSVFSHWSMRQEMDDAFGKDCSPMFTNDQCENKVEYFPPISGKSDARQKIQNNKRDDTLSTVRNRSPVLHSISSFSTTGLQTLFTSANSVGINNILNFCERYCGSLPVYHPEALVLYLYSGKIKRAYASVLHLTEYLRSVEISANETSGKSEKLPHRIPEICLSKYFEDGPTAPARTKGSERNDHVHSKPSDKQLLGDFFHLVGENSFNSFNTPWVTSQQYETRGLKDALESLQHVIPLHFEEKIHMFAVVDLLVECCDPQYSSTYNSFDEPGRRFWIAARLKQLHFHQKVGRPAAADELAVESWMIAWAYHSDCQENLFNSVISSEPTWKELRNMGVGYWLTNVSQLRLTMEKLARSQYMLKKDPKDCALLYLALNRLQVLAGLFRLSKDERDRPLVGFLSRNFQEEKNKAAALKNAYVLLGRHQLELAIAFFILGGDHSSAVTVCVKNLGDEQLALVICRLVEGFGGPLERQLISSALLPNAYDSRDCWLSSLFEWDLGNYSVSVKALTEPCLNPPADSSNFLYSPALSDPNIGQYCRMLASKNSMRNAIGDVMAVELSKWATAITAKALQTCGFSLEALDCISSSLNNLDIKGQTSASDIPEYDALYGILNLCPKTADSVCNWFLGSVARSLESQSLLNSAMHYVSKLLLDFPDWQVDNLMFPVLLNKDHDDTYINGESLETNSKLKTGMLILENKFSLKPTLIINMILIYAYNRGTMLTGYNTLHRFIPSASVDDNCNPMDEFLLQRTVSRILLKATKELSDLFVKFMLYHSITVSVIPSDTGSDDRYFTSYLQLMSLTGIINLIWSLRNFAKLHEPSSLHADKFLEVSVAFDHLLLFSFFGFTWFARSLKGVFLATYPILGHLDKESFHETIVDHIVNFSPQNYKEVLKDIGESLFSTHNKRCQEPNEVSLFKFENGPWLLLGISLLKRLHVCFVNELKRLKNGTAGHPETLSKPKQTIPLFLVNAVALSAAYVFLMLKKHFLSILWQKIEKGIPICAVFELEESIHFKTSEINDLLNQESDHLQLLNHEDVKPLLVFFTKFLLKPEELCRNLSNEDLECRNQLCGCWDDIIKDISFRKECKELDDSDVNLSAASTASSTKAETISVSGMSDGGYFEGARVNYTLEGAMFFQTPKDVYKKSGDLIEAICSNSIDEQQVVLASNRKGILYFNIDFEQPVRHQEEYIWETSDWPYEGWAEPEVTATHTSDERVIRMDCKRGISDATARSVSLARPGRDLTGGGAFGIPGYAGIGASGFGWNVHDNFVEFTDVPATLTNASARALCSHPSRPLFLVGSSNSQVYLWEFGKERATATYGVLPDLSGLPPYALASISSLHFDYYGQRFATAAMDGTVCTWQLEVGGKGNVYPTESSQCFNNHTSDLTYISSGGSVIAAAGYNTNNVNVVIWDTLAPATSQASLVCHEGGARSLSVLDTGIGCGSLSPIIVTGGKNGDVGLYDFRFVATGRMRRNRNFSEQTLSSLGVHSGSALALKSVDCSNGMLWAIPKAHSGSITKISAIPDSSLFLTGSKDGDVKLWDARKSQLVAHWPKLHDKHTFLQPGSGNFGGIVRAAVTDIQVHPRGFLTCGGDGLVKFVQLKKFQFPS